MQLIKRGRAIPDPWDRIDDPASVPAGGNVIVSLARWREAAATLVTDLIVLEFPSFVDRRHYSNAVRLRSFYGFAGEIRAAGDVQRDQLNYLLRCGFDAFEVADDVDIAEFLRGADEFSGVYQYALDGRTPAYRLRGGFM